MAESAWKVLRSRTIYTRPPIALREDEIERPGGAVAGYAVLEVGPSVGVLPVIDPGRVILVRQYRHIARGHFWEIPGGGVHPGESLEAAAQRELMEEAGYRAGRLIRLGTFFPSSGYVDETAHVFLGEDLVRESLRADEDEQLEVRAFPFDEAVRMVLDGVIMESLSVVALLLADRSRR